MQPLPLCFPMLLLQFLQESCCWANYRSLDGSCVEGSLTEPAVNITAGAPGSCEHAASAGRAARPAASSANAPLGQLQLSPSDPHILTCCSGCLCALGKLKPAARCSALLALSCTSAICNRTLISPTPALGHCSTQSSWRAQSSSQPLTTAQTEQQKKVKMHQRHF